MKIPVISATSMMYSETGAYRVYQFCTGLVKCKSAVVRCFEQRVSVVLDPRVL